MESGRRPNRRIEGDLSAPRPPAAEGNRVEPGVQGGRQQGDLRRIALELETIRAAGQAGVVDERAYRQEARELGIGEGIESHVIAGEFPGRCGCAGDDGAIRNWSRLAT